MRTRRVAVLFAGLFLLPLAARAAIPEKEILDNINDTVAVIRYLHEQIAEIEANLNLVRAARDLTTRQLEAQRRLYQSELAKGHKQHAALMEANLKRLERHMAKLNQFNFEKIYGDQVKKLKEQIKQMHVELDARVAEYEALFGKKPHVELGFEKEIEQRKVRRAEAGYFLKLD